MNTKKAEQDKDNKRDIKDEKQKVNGDYLEFHSLDGEIWGGLTSEINNG